MASLQTAIFPIASNCVKKLLTQKDNKNESALALPMITINFHGCNFATLILYSTAMVIRCRKQYLVVRLVYCGCFSLAHFWRRLEQ